MGKQYNKVLKRRRRKQYLRRKKEQEKLNATVKPVAKVTKKPTEEKTEKPVAKEDAKPAANVKPQDGAISDIPLPNKVKGVFKKFSLLKLFLGLSLVLDF